MGKDSGIQWTDHTFNPWWGCEKVSAGCKHCYADAFAKRPIHVLPGGGKGALPIWGGAETSRRFFGDGHWHEPKKWNLAAERKGARARVFCASMADVCEDRADLIAERGRLARLILATPWLDWLLLTKRPENYLPMFGGYFGTYWPANVWVGATVEEVRSKPRINALRDVPARIRFLSIEPLVESLGALDLSDIHWAIVGGESGKGARPFDIGWAHDIVRQCRRQGAAPFVKQWGAHPVDMRRDGSGLYRLSLRDPHGGDTDEWIAAPELRVREFPT